MYTPTGVFRMFLNLVLACAVRGEPSQGVAVEGAAGEDGCIDRCGGVPVVWVDGGGNESC